MARKLEKAEQRYDKDAQELEKLRAKMDKMRANCSHVPVMDEEKGKFFCKDCGKVLGYTEQRSSHENDMFDDEE